MLPAPLAGFACKLTHLSSHQLAAVTDRFMCVQHPLPCHPQLLTLSVEKSQASQQSGFQVAGEISEHQVFSAGRGVGTTGATDLAVNQTTESAASFPFLGREALRPFILGGSDWQSPVPTHRAQAPCPFYLQTSMIPPWNLRPERKGQRPCQWGG